MREEALADLSALAQPQLCARDELIWEIGATHNPAYILVAGSLRLYYLSPEGQELTLAILHAGDICGLYVDDALALSSVAQALDAGTILYRLPRRLLLRLIETSPALSCAVLEQAWRQLAHARAHLVELTCCDIRTRVAHMLARLASPDHDCVVRVTRERLGLLIGASREGVTRALDSLRDYDAADNVITQTYPNTTTAAFTYNAANQLTGLVHKQGGSPLWSYSYGRDALGGLSSSADPLDGQSHTYGYSPLRQLTSDQRSSGTTSWTPDGASQLTQRVDPTGPATSTLSYDAASELGSLGTVSGTTTTRNVTLSYNAAGDRTSQNDSVSGSSSSYGYDHADGDSSHPRGCHRDNYTNAKVKPT